ncbi:MAG: hypothetical protein FWE80_01060 [Oscillospiraceae bacterium]|nr:hypothetical protein [Oscillospiraceae bacterium]
MKKGLTELVFILDRSGSMSGLEQDTIGGYNGLLEKQKAQEGEAVVTTVLFDDRYELLHDRINLKGIAPITGKEYFVRGSTALLDAIGRTIDKIGNAQKHTAEAERAERVLVVITTDGMENASREYRPEKVKAMVERQKEKFGWEFLFIGANIDAIATAGQFGIAPDRAVKYRADSIGTDVLYETVSETVCCMRTGMPITADWKENIETDFEGRK